MIKTFRGKLESGGEDKIMLSTKKGKVGYRIKTFQVMPSSFASSDQVAIVKITKVSYTPSSSVDFSDLNVLGAAFFRIGNLISETHADVIIFDQEVFNQDVFINLYNIDAGLPMNYYIELETETLSDNAAAVSTLRDIRLNPQVGE